MNQSSSRYSAVPFAILRKLRLVRQRKIWIQVASAMVAALAVLLAAMAVAMLIDWLATLYDSRWRVVLTTMALLAAALTSAGWLIMAWRRLLGLERIAGDVDRQIPQLAERWTTMTRLGPDAENPNVVHPAMLRRVATEAASWEPHVEPQSVVSMSSLMRALLGLTAITAVLAIAVVFNSHQTFVLMQRFWLPGSSISATELVNVPGDVVVGRGEPLALAAEVRGTPVERAMLFLRSEAGEPRALTLIAHGQEPLEFSHRVRTVEHPFEYRFRAGDGQTEWHSVGVADRPEIDKLQLTVTPPEYTGQAAKTFEKMPQRVSALQKSELELALRPKADVERVELRMAGDKTVRLTKDDDGWFRWKITLEEGFTISPVLTESHGLTNRRAPKCQFTVYQDKPPAVKVLTPDDQMAVRPDDTIQITFSATDDVGIGTAELLVYDESAAAAGGEEPVPIASIPIPLGEQQGARAIQQTIDLDMQKFMADDGSELSYEIRVREDRARGSSSPASSQPNANAIASNSPANGMSQSNSAATSATNNSASPDQAPSASQASNDEGSNSQPPESNAPNSAGEQPPASSLASNQTPNANSASESPSTGANNQPPAAKQAENQSSSTAAPSESQAAANSKQGEKPADVSPQDGRAGADRMAANSKQSESRDGQPATGSEQQTANSGNQSSSGQQAAAPEKSQTAANQPASSSPANNDLASNQSGAKSEKDPSSSSPAANASPGRSSESPAKPDESSTARSSANESNKMADNQSNSGAKQGKETSEDNPAPRTASTGRQSLSPDRKGEEASDSMPQKETPENDASRMANNSAQSPDASQQSDSDSQPSSPSSQQANSKSQPSGQSGKQSNKKSQQANSNQKPSASNQANNGQQRRSASNQANSGEQTPSSPSDRPPGDSMSKRTLDVAQSSASQRMRLKVDKWAGSFAGQQRAKLEMAISPELEALDKTLEKGQKTARGVLDELASVKKWRGAHDREVTNAERSTVNAQEIINRLQERSKGTPYAFIGLQVVDIGLAHVAPAKAGFWKALESEGDDRVTSVRDAWQHLSRARELLKDLRGQYERSRREFQLAESMERVKKMYQVYLENSQALLQTQESDPTRYGRKRVEFELDDEYLKRLQEVLEMRRDLRAELARILAEDPRLLRRFMDSLRYRSNNLREQMAELVSEQADLNREVRAWTLVDDADRPRIAKILLLRQVQDAAKIATAAGELQSRYQTWLPLDRESKDADLAAATKTMQEMATAATELSSTAEKFVADAQRVTVKNTEPPSAEEKPEAEATASPEADQTAAMDGMLTDAQTLYGQLNNLEVALRQLAAREEGAETALFAANRLVDTRKLISDTSAWVRQLRAHKAGNYTGAAEVDQYRLAMKTDELAGKLGTIEQTLAGLMQRPDGSLPEPIANKARDFITTLDKQVSPNQLAAVYALHSNQLPRANERQKAAGDALTKAEASYDELMKLAIAELDKMPVQDPVADLLDDPTLDELLAELEQEVPIEELLGIPQRPSNLRIVGDWMRPGGDNAIAAGGGAANLIRNQMRQDQQRARQQLNQAYQRAIARALKESTRTKKVEIPRAVKLSDWNRLVSKLGNDLRQGRDKAPPEQYRRAIEQYFSQISGVVAENEERAP